MEALQSSSRARRGKRRPIAEINVVPYIDVVLVLLVIFMAVAPIVTQGVKIDLPPAPSKPVDPNDLEDPLFVTVRGDGAVFVNLGASDTNDIGTRVSLDTLSEQAGKVIRARPDVPVFVRGDERIAYGRVIEVMGTLQVAGARSVGLLTEPPPPQR
jgi:biopolymer transport protein TolR